MNKHLLILCAILSAFAATAQLPNSAPASVAQASLATRSVSGIVRDSNGESVAGALVKLESPKDTLSTSANDNGIFVFENVRSATFVLTVSNLGYQTQVKRMLNNDATPRLVLDPVVLVTDSKMLNEVVIDGTPSIIYKTDTVEYRAADYKVRENATVDELLKKMEGMEVGSDGSLTHQGQEVVKARLNGKDFSGGDIALAIQNLPAEIVDRIQIVDDYGDMAARTGVKDGDPQKVLNITTRADRSVGNTARVVGQYGSNDRYNGQLFAQRINANQQLGVIGRVANTITGVASTGILGGATNGGGDGMGGAGGNTGGSGGGGRNAGGGAGAGGGSGSTGPSSGGNNGGAGTSKIFAPSINYRDQLGKKVQVVASYRYNSRDNESENNSYGQRNSTLGPSDFASSGSSDNYSLGHNLNAQVDYTIDSANFLQITPTFGFSSQKSASTSFTDQVNRFNTGLEHQVISGLRSTENKAPDYGIAALYVHVFKKPKRNMSFQLNLSSTDNTQNGEVDNTFQYYADTTRNNLISDSLSHLITQRTSRRNSLRSVLTYSEPLSSSSSIEFTAQVTRSSYANTAVSDSVLGDGSVQRLSRLDNVYDYSFTERRLSLNYRYSGSKFSMSLGGRYVPYTLSGTRLNNSGDGLGVSTSRTTSRLIPLLYLGYQWSSTQRLTLRYTGMPKEPDFNQLQPFVDRTDPNNIIIGNPDLKPSFSNGVDLTYNNYFANARANISFNLNGSLIQNQVAANVVQVSEPVMSNGQVTTRTINQTYYVNLDGAHAIVGRYNLSKQFGDRRYNLSLNGNVTYSHGNGFSNNESYHTTNWRFNQRFGPRLLPTDNIEINPYVAYDLSRNFNTLPNATQTMVQTTSLAIDGKFWFWKTFQLNYSATKSFVTGYGSLGNPSPLVINAGFEKEFFPRKNLVLTFNVFDILHQNNFIQQTLTDNGFTNTLSNTLSRYFLVGLRWNLQKWSGTPTRNGKELKRRGDGSFIY